MDALKQHPDDPERFEAHHVDALADGELSPDRVTPTLAAIRADPALEKRLATQLRLRQAVARFMAAEAAQAPEALRDRIANLIQEHGDDPAEPTPEPEPTPIVGRIGGSGGRPVGGGAPLWLRWSPAAVAAILAIVAWVGFTQDVRPPISGGAAQVVSAEQLELFAWRHVTCAGEPTELKPSPELPRQIEDAARDVSVFLDTPVAGDFDLAEAGFVFVGAGACRVPGSKAAHLVYRADPRTGRHDAVSLWITTRAELSRDLARRVPDVGLHVIGDIGSRQAHPMVVWSSGDVVFFLMGENPARVREAAEMVRLSAQTNASPV